MPDRLPLSPLNGRLDAIARAEPRSPALLVASTDRSEHSLTRAELLDQADLAARNLASAGTVDGSRVLVALPNGIGHVTATHGAWRLGATPVPVRHDLPAWERERLLTLVAPTVVVADWDERPTSGPTVLGSADLERACDTGYEQIEPAVGFGLVSSGSTGDPKLILKPPTEVLSKVEVALRNHMGLAPGHRMLVTTPCYHASGFLGVHATLLHGSSVVLAERFDAAHAVDLIARHGVHTTILVTTMLHRIAKLPRLHKASFDSIVSILQAASACPSWVVERWIELVGGDRFYMSYGSTEDVGAALISGAEWERHRGSVGRGLGTDIRVVGPEGVLCADGEVGDVYMRYADAAPAFDYVGATAAPTTLDGFTSVGDLGWLDDGYLFIADRRVDLIVSGGANVYPAEVEAALGEHPAVKDCAVIGLPSDEWGQAVHAVVEVDRAVQVDELELRAHCRERLAAYKVPKSFERVDALPRTEVGKLNRAALIERRVGPA